MKALALAGVNRPTGVGLAINRVLNREIVLGKIGLGMSELYLAWFGFASVLGNFHFDFAQDKIAVIRAARPALADVLVGDRFQLHVGDAAQRRIKFDRVGFF